MWAPLTHIYGPENKIQEWDLQFDLFVLEVFVWLQCEPQEKTTSKVRQPG